MIPNRLREVLDRCRDGTLAVTASQAACGFLAIQAALLVWSAARQSPTVDEPMHLAAGVRILQDVRFDLDRGNPPLVKILAAWPVVLSGCEVDWSARPDSFAVANDFLEANGSRSFTLMTCARWGLVPVSLLAGWIIYHWAKDLFGPRGGLVALILWCFNPFILANAELVTGDMTAASMAVTAAWLYRRWLRQPGIVTCLAAGVGLGLALVAKYVCLVLVPLFGMAWLGRDAARLRHWNSLPIARIVQFLVILFLAADVINLFYLGQGTLSPLGEYRSGKALVERVFGEEPGPLGQAVASLPVPLPWDYVRGIDEISQVMEHEHTMYVRGKWYSTLPWHYYLVWLGAKMPEGMLVILALSVWAFFTTSGRVGWKEEAFLASCLLAFFVFVAAVTSIKYLRYILPVLPFLVIWCGRAGRDAIFERSLPGRIVVAGLTACCVATVWVYPHQGAYFNLLSGGTANGHHHLIESSYDWGQDLLYLRRWLDQNPQVEQLTLAYFGRIDPRLAGIDFELPPRQPRLNSDRKMAEDGGPEPGWHAISVSLVHGFPWSDLPDGKGGYESLRFGDFEYFQHFEPVDRAGYSIFIYHISPEEADRVREKLGLSRKFTRGVEDMRNQAGL